LQAVKVGITHTRHDRRLYDHEFVGVVVVHAADVPGRATARLVERVVIDRYRPWATIGLTVGGLPKAVGQRSGATARRRRTYLPSPPLPWAFAPARPPRIADDATSASRTERLSADGVPIRLARRGRRRQRCASARRLA
jgi:hypothetical protein